MRRSIADRPWVFVRQVHGARVVVVDKAPGALFEADALVSGAGDGALAVLGADCALVGLSSPEGVIGAAHAGWRGLTAGVLDATAEKMRAFGATRIEAVASACVHAECYPFSARDLDAAAFVLGDAVRSTTPDGRPALDLACAVRLGLEQAEVDLALEVDSCTACGDEWFSHRARKDRERQALAIWRAAPR